MSGRRCVAVSHALTLAHSANDPTLGPLWHDAEQARCGRSAPPALGASGPLPARSPQQLGDWADRVTILDLTSALENHDPMSYLLDQVVFDSARSALFDTETFLDGTAFKK